MDLKRNAARCLKCQDEIESRSRHDFVWCKCGAIFVDGGLAYMRRGGDLMHLEELSEDEGGLVTRHSKEAPQ